MSSRLRAQGTRHPMVPQQAALTPAALLGKTPVAGGTLSALGPRSPWPAVALPSLGVALGALSGRSTGAWLATLAALKAEVSFLWHRCSVMALPSPQDPASSNPSTLRLRPSSPKAPPLHTKSLPCSPATPPVPGSLT